MEISKLNTKKIVNGMIIAEYQDFIENNSKKC